MVLISKHIEDYEVISILGTTINSTCYKVKNKITSEIFMWKAVCCEKLTELEKLVLIKKINSRKLVENPYIIKIYDFIMHEENEVLYLITEFCKNGNLSNMIQMCLKQDEYLSEDFIWQVLYQLTCGIKVTNVFYSNLHLENIFLDDTFKIKFYNFDALSDYQDCSDQNAISTVRQLIYELCLLQPSTSEKIFDERILEIPSYYSESLHDIIEFMFNSNIGVKSTIDAILCHPKVLVKSALNTNKICVKNNKPQHLKLSHKDLDQNVVNSAMENAYHQQVENIKNRELALKIRENQVIEKEHELNRRYKKLAHLDHKIRDKILRADLYLKKCQDSVMGSQSSAGIASCDFLDTFSLNCDDIAPETKSMYGEEQLKPSSLMRTASERRVRFKGHSPLKSICNRSACNKENRFSKLYNCSNVDENSSTARLNLDDTMKTAANLTENTVLKKSEKWFSKQNKGKKKERFLSAFAPKNKKYAKPSTDLNEFNDDNKSWEDIDSACTPISWTKETKQQAFELLRMMNNESNKENLQVPVKHTCL